MKLFVYHNTWTATHLSIYSFTLNQHITDTHAANNILLSWYAHASHSVPSRLCLSIYQVCTVTANGTFCYHTPTHCLKYSERRTCSSIINIQSIRSLNVALSCPMRVEKTSENDTCVAYSYWKGCEYSECYEKQLHFYLRVFWPNEFLCRRCSREGTS